MILTIVGIVLLIVASYRGALDYSHPFPLFIAGLACLALRFFWAIGDATDGKFPRIPGEGPRDG